MGSPKAVRAGTGNKIFFYIDLYRFGSLKDAIESVDSEMHLS